MKSRIAALALALSALHAQSPNPAMWSNFRYRMIGPERGGRVTAVTGIPSQPSTFYMGSTGGGVWKTLDAGHTWTNLSDGQIPLGSMGAVEVSLSNPDIVYVGTGSSKIRSNVSIGRGIYKSTDGGDHWTKLAGGLPNELFGRSNVAISAAAPNRIYALIEAKPGSGLYRSEDAGATWSIVNGSGNLITRPFYYTTLGVDPMNADVIFVGDEGWYRSADGGKTFRTSPAPHGD